VHILINDFIGGVLDRGIPLYVRNLIHGLEEEGFQVTVIRAPSLFRKLPRSLFYVMSVLTEQFILPAIGIILRADITIYPYNSIALLDILSGRGRIVVHDLELLNKSSWAPSKLYVLACYKALKRFNHPVFTIAALIQKKIFESGVFGDCPVTVLPNTFYVFEDLVRTVPGRRAEKSILLCTGSTENKDLASVAADYLPAALRAGFRVSILGLHKKNDLAPLQPLNDFLTSGQLRVCGQLSDAEVAREYKSHEMVWVHSRREGFGRCVVEGRLAGSTVICSAIPEFTSLQDPAVFLYADLAGFTRLLNGLPQAEPMPRRYTAYPYKNLLREATAPMAARSGVTAS
jgi:glycosyltransferase involved in cell wall biosynthesis